MLCYKNVVSTLGCKGTKFFSFCQIIMDNFGEIEVIEQIDVIDVIEQIDVIDVIEQIGK
mgnify:CR=1 FL=1